jgi:DNA mismatch repair ATPase MutS
MLNPSCDIHLLNERLNTVSYFLKPDQASTTGKCKEFLKKAKDISAIMHRFQVKQGSVNDWLNLYNVRFQKKKVTLIENNSARQLQVPFRLRSF